MSLPRTPLTTYYSAEVRQSDTFFTDEREGEEVFRVAEVEQLIDALREEMERETAQLAVVAFLLDARPHETEITAAWRIRRELAFLRHQRAAKALLVDEDAPQ